MRIIKDFFPEMLGAIFAVLLLGFSYLFFSFLIAVAKTNEFDEVARSLFNSDGSIIPVSVLVAVLIFILKELLELLRSIGNANRKKVAIKALLVEELELNHWALKSIKRVIDSVRSEFQINKTPVFEIVLSNDGLEHFECIRDDGHNSGQAFPKIFDQCYKDLALQIAELDNQLHEATTNCYKSIAELQHLRNGVYRYIDKNGDDKAWVEGFLSYAEDELSDIYQGMNTLYVFCAGKKLETHRLR